MSQLETQKFKTFWVLEFGIYLEFCRQAGWVLELGICLEFGSLDYESSKELDIVNENNSFQYCKHNIFFLSLLNNKIYSQMIEQIESTTKNYKELRRILGKKYVREAVESPYDFIRIAKRGINSRVITNFHHHFNLSVGETAQMLNTSESTIYRWTKANKPLDKNYTVKLFEIADLFLYGIEVFESQDNFFKWLNLPNTALGGMEPQELIEIPGGVAKIKTIIGRIEYGVYS